MLFNTNLINETFEVVNLLKLTELDLKNMMLKAAEAIFDHTVIDDIKKDIEMVTVAGEKEAISEEAKD